MTPSDTIWECVGCGVFSAKPHSCLQLDGNVHAFARPAAGSRLPLAVSNQIVIVETHISNARLRLDDAEDSLAALRRMLEDPTKGDSQ